MSLSLKRLNSCFRGKTVIITGHTGFKGSWLSIWLQQLGAKVIGFSKDIPTRPSHFEAIKLSNRVQHNLLDVTETQHLTRLFNDIRPDFIFHLAAQPLVLASFEEPELTWKSNLLGTISVLEALKTIPNKCTAVFVTSDKCYQNIGSLWGYRECDKLGGEDPYSASKAAAEIALSSYFESFFSSNEKVNFGIGRAGNVIGGGDWAANRIVPDCIRCWSRSESVTIRNPDSTRPWQHVLEPISGYLTLAMELTLNQDLCGEPFNFGPPTNENKTVREVVSKMADIWDIGRWEHQPSTNKLKEHGLLQLNCEKAYRYFGWRSVWDFDSTIAETVEWYKNYYAQPSTDTFDFSTLQIQRYCEAARLLNLPWTE